MELYVANEKYDGYLRDGCVFKKDVTSSTKWRQQSNIKMVYK